MDSTDDLNEVPDFDPSATDQPDDPAWVDGLDPDFDPEDFDAAGLPIDVTQDDLDESEDVITAPGEEATFNG